MNIPHAYYICTAEESRQMDTDTIEEFGIDGFTLMEIAGSSAAGHLLDGLPAGSHGLYLCGKGNNAGDAVVVARYLAQHGHKATLIFLSGTDDLSSDTSHNLSLLEKIAQPPAADAITIRTGWSEFDGSGDYDFVVDGMLGTGLTSALRGDYASATEWANRSGLPVFAIDIPTGLHADTGRVMGKAVRAYKTFTFGARKQGFYLDEGYECTGEILFCDLPFPNYLKNCNTYLLDEAWVHRNPHAPARHKYEAGVLYLVAGSEGLTGAAVMAARSAWAEGVGAVILICPRGILPIYENTLPQIIKKPVGKKEDVFFKKGHLDEVLTTIGEREGDVIFGPGIGRESSTLAFAGSFFERYTGNLLIDADALWCLAQQEDWRKPPEAEWMITPHPGELSGLLPQELTGGAERLNGVRELSRNREITTISKGFPTIIGTPEGNCYLTGYDTRVFARAGFGDVLAGKIGAYRSLGETAIKSAALGLLDGYTKACAKQKNKLTALEPSDLI